MEKIKIISNKSIPTNRFLFAIISLFSLVILSYFVALDASWQFDDYGNIVNNPNIELKELNLDSLRSSFIYRGSIDRPVSRFSFALNWYFNQYEVRKYRIINIIIHFLSAAILFLIIINLLKSPNIGKYDEKNGFVIALLASVFWAINPIQTQAVTYIVQRMTSLAAFFYLLSMLCYIKGRMEIKLNSILFYTASIICFALALGSKENAITLPLSLLLIEITFFQEIRNRDRILRISFIVTVTIIVLLWLSIWLFLDNRPLSILNYNDRPFTLYQRLLTEPRVLIFYLSQIFYPIPQRLSIEHDILISTSIFFPWTTGISFAAVIGMIGTGVLLIRKYPVLSFSILFFFLAHVVESSILPLEIAFEHRNYLPSAFLFFPIAMGIQNLITFYQGNYVSCLVAVFTGFIVAGLVAGSAIRNKDWETRKSLSEDAIDKTGALARPYLNLATHYAELGNYEETIYLLKKAVSMKYHKLQNMAKPFHNLGVISYNRGEYERALEYEKKAMDIHPGLEFHYTMVLSLIQLNRLDEALDEIASSVTTSHVHKRRYLNLAGKIFLYEGRYSEALSFFKQSLKNNLDDFESLLNIGITLNRAGRFEIGKRFLILAQRINPYSMDLKLAFIENSVMSDGNQLDHYLNSLLHSERVFSIVKKMEELSKFPVLIPLSEAILLPVLANKFNSISNDLLQLTSID